MHITLPDLINPIEGMIAGLFYELERITWSRDYRIPGIDIERICRQRGIRIYGRITNDPAVVGFHVRRSQARWARYILNARLDGRPLPPAWNPSRSAAPHSLIDRLVDLLDAIFGAP